MRRLVLPLVLSFAAGPALSLSCLPMDVATSFNDAVAASERYIIVHGTLEFDEGKLPEVDMDRQDQTPPQTDIPARLRGKSLSKSGFKTDFDRPITLRAMCLGPWCGRAVSGTEYLSFLQITDDGYMLAVNPCGGFDFAEPTGAMLNTVKRCFKDGTCAN
ncbi:MULTISPECIES: hypothetical protein [unclassified Roseovarius]|uniref:hypothetical protein n=1 Tax=unclassified Roseovarius TaxID=2614913 RepID=UPI00273F637F|nr:MULTISPECIES: hypothetical protein [unclassified Roseovarius]